MAFLLQTLCYIFAWLLKLHVTKVATPEQIIFLVTRSYKLTGKKKARSIYLVKHKAARFYILVNKI